MNITIDGSGNVSLNTGYDVGGIETLKNKMDVMLNELKTFDPSQIEALKNELNDLYPTLVNFTIFIDEWDTVLDKVVL